MKAGLVGKYAVVVDRETKRVIAAGLVVDVKAGNFNLISFDRIAFYHENGNCHYRVFILLPQNAIEDLTIHPTPSSYLILPFNRNGMDADIYLENTEYDVEVCELVTALNTVPGIQTTGSCSGHGRDHLFVTMFFSSLDSLSRLASIIEDSGLWFTLSTDIRVYQDKTPGKIHLRLQSGYLGNAAYEEAKRLANILKENWVNKDGSK